MPRITYIFVYCLHLTSKLTKTEKNNTPPAIPVMPFYWKTSSTDHVPDYWNHGPIIIPGQDRFTMTTKKPDIFPPWLTRTVSSEPPFPFINMTTISRIMHKTSPIEASTMPLTLTETISTETTTTKTTILAHTETISDIISMKEAKLTTAGTITTNTTVLTYAETNSDTISSEELEFTETYTTPSITPIDESTMKATTLVTSEIKETAETKKQFKHKETIATTTLLSTAALVNFLDTDPFSLFLRNLLRALSVKNSSDLSALVEAFIEYLTLSLVNGKLSVLGVETNLYITKMVRDMNRAPDALHKNVYQAYNMLANRFAELAEDINELIDYTDDTYDEAEEEAMQDVLNMTALFPHSSKTAEEIAQSFINDIFLNPMKRLAGTWRGKTLFNMTTDVVNKRMSVERSLNSIDEHVKLPRQNINIISNVDTYGYNFRRNIFNSNNKRKRAMISEKRYGDRKEKAKSDDSLKRHVVLRPNFFNEDTVESDDSTESEFRYISRKHEDNSNIQTGSLNKKMRISPLQHIHYKEINFRAHDYNSLQNKKGAVKNNLNKERKLTAIASNTIRTHKGPYSRQSNQRHTILLPTGHDGTNLVKGDIPEYVTQMYGDKYSKSRNVLKYHYKQEQTTKSYNKLPIYGFHKALRNNHPLTNKKAKQNCSFHHQSRHGLPHKIKHTFSENNRPKLNNYKLTTTTTKAYTKIVNKIRAPYNSEDISKNDDVRKIIVDSQVKQMTLDEDNKEIYSNTEAEISEDESYSDNGPYKSKKKYNSVLLHRPIKPGSQNKLQNKLLSKKTKPYTTKYKEFENQVKVFRNKPPATNKNKDLFNNNMKQGPQSIQKNIITMTSFDTLNFGGQRNPKQPHQNTGKQTYNEYTKYKIKTTTKKSNAKTATQDNAKEIEKYIHDEKEEIYDETDDDDSTSESASSAHTFSEDPDEIMIRKAPRLSDVTQLRSAELTELYSTENFRFRKHSKHKRHHKNKHKKSKHRKHRHKSYSRSKYEKLKRKYRKLKRIRDLIKQQRQLNGNKGETPFQIPTENTPNHEQRELFNTTVTANTKQVTPVINENIGRVGLPNYSNYDKRKPEEINNRGQMENTPYPEYDDTNLMLADYADVNADGSKWPGGNRLSTLRSAGPPNRVPINSKRSVIKDDANIKRKTNNNNTNMILSKGRPKRSKVNKPIYRATEYSDEEFKLRENLYDALRHMDFHNKYILSRRSMIHGNSSEVISNYSHETDVEAVLKRNIFKAVKKLLKR